MVREHQLRRVIGPWIGRIRWQAIYCTWYPSCLPVLRKLAKVVIERAILLHGEDDVIDARAFNEPGLLSPGASPVRPRHPPATPAAALTPKSERKLRREIIAALDAGMRLAVA
jgi:hypothetical protein